MTTDIVPVEVPRPVTVFGTDDPAAIVRRVSDIATPLAEFIKDRGMSRVLQKPKPGEKPREYVMIEGWSFMGAMLGVAPVTREVREIRDGDNLVGFEARVELVTRDGSVVGGGIGECSWVESNWAGRDPYAVKSMAQTRATGKAYRLAFGFIMQAAGFESTPAEEMPSEERGAQTVLPPQSRQTRQEPRTAEAETGDGSFANAGAFLGWALSTHKLGRKQVLDILGVDHPEAIAPDFEDAREAIEEHMAGVR